MQLLKLIKEINIKKIIGNTDIEIESLVCESEAVTNGCLFFCINGTRIDGHEYAVQAEKNGAIAIVCQKEQNVNITQIIVENVRDTMSVVAGNFYGRADKKLKIIGITGTNGKTTTTNLIYQMLNSLGYPTALIGTLGTFFNDRFIEPTLTTPDPIELHKQLNEMYVSKIQYVVMEVSAHALFFDKIKGIDFSIVVFTNFTHDHLDFFKSMDEYKKAKLKLFSGYNFEYAVTNNDDAVGREISSQIENSISYGIENPADVFAIRIKEFSNKIEYVVNLFDYVESVKIPLIGRFNVYNSLCAQTVCSLLGVDAKTTINAINKVSAVCGRLEKVYNGEYSIFIDYAHTPDGLKKSIVALKKITKGKVICVFGCGGNRDKLKRYKMGKISGENADFTIITTDNPRYEEPMEIMIEIEKGVLSTTKKYLLIEDRKSAIEYAINFAKPQDIILIAGKGSENYQEVLGIKKPYNDKDTVNEILRSTKN